MEVRLGNDRRETKERTRLDSREAAFWSLLSDAHDATGHPKLYEVRTALDAHGVAELYQTSQGFANEIANYEAQREVSGSFDSRRVSPF